LENPSGKVARVSGSSSTPVKTRLPKRETGLIVGEQLAVAA